MVPRYIVFFLHPDRKVGDYFPSKVQKVKAKDTARTLVFPDDAIAFCFLRTQLEPDILRWYFRSKICEVFKPLDPYRTRRRARLCECYLPIESNKIYVISFNGHKKEVFGKYPLRGSQVGEKEEIEFKITYVDEAKLLWEEPRDSFEITYGTPTARAGRGHTEVRLTENGGIEVADWDIASGGIWHPSTKCDLVISCIREVAKEYPIIYKEILRHIEGREEDYMKRIYEFCKNKGKE